MDKEGVPFPTECQKVGYNLVHRIRSQNNENRPKVKNNYPVPDIPVCVSAYVEGNKVKTLV